MWFHFLRTADAGKAETVAQTLLLAQTSGGAGPSLTGNLPRSYPLEFARATNGYLYMTNGLTEVIKWDGITSSTSQAGVTAPTTALTISATGSGLITGTYSAYTRFIDVDGNPSNLSPVSNTIDVDTVDTFIYENVPSPDLESNVVRKQILRNVAGSTITYYVDIDTTDLTGTTFTSTRSDSDLLVQVAVPLFSDDLSINLAARFGVPPNDKPFIAYFFQRLWLYGVTPYADGHAEVTKGSTTVTGVGTQWPSTFVGRVFYSQKADRGYSITAVDEAAQTITLATAYEEVTDKFALYSIRPIPSRRHALAYSEAGRFDAWPATQSLEVASSDDIEDEGTGLVATQSFLYILQRRHIYRLSYLTDPVVDGGVFLSARRGCVNNRSWATADGFVYCLDDRGIYRFDGSDRTQDLSSPIQDIFWFDNTEEKLRINWRASRFFHCSHDRNDATMRWFVSFSGNRYPRHALCFNYGTNNWWVEEYPFAVGDSDILKSVNPVSIVTSQFAKIYAIGEGTLDGIIPGGVDTRSEIASASWNTISSSVVMALPATGVVGNTLSIVSGRGKGQRRVIYQVSGDRFDITSPWTELPDSTSKLQIGAIEWNWRSGWYRWTYVAQDQPRRITASFLPTVTETTMDMRVFRDYSTVAEVAAYDWPQHPDDTSGVTMRRDDDDVVFDLQQDHGYGYLTLDGYKDFQEWRRDVVQIEARGFTGESPVFVYEFGVEGAQ
jgi:hypothetical protein